VIIKNSEKIPTQFIVRKMLAQTLWLYIGALSDISKIKSKQMELLSLNDELSRTNERLKNRDYRLTDFAV
jgi:hypothetical protein